MEKGHTRRFVRMPVYLGAALISGGNNYAAFIGNVSEGGAFAKTSPTTTAADFVPGTLIELKFQIPSGEELNLTCEVIWLHTKKIEAQGLINSMGMEIIDPPSTFREFLKTLN